MQRFEVDQDIFGKPCLVCGKRFRAEGLGSRPGRDLLRGMPADTAPRTSACQAPPSPRRARDEEMRVVG